MARPAQVRKRKCLADLARARRMAAWAVSHLDTVARLHLLAEGGAECVLDALCLVDVASGGGPAQAAQAQPLKRVGRR